MRIAFVAPLVAPLSDATARGSHVVIAELARALSARGHEVVVFCAQGSYLKDVQLAPIAVDPRAGDSALVAGRRAGGPNRALTSAFEELFWHVREWAPDVVSQHAFDAEAFDLSRDLPTVHTLHLNPTEPTVVDAVRATNPLLVAVSHDSARRWVAAGARRVSAIPNGVPEFPAMLGAPEPFALVAGRITPEKGTAAAIRVARRAALEVVLVGEVYDRGYFAREVVPLLDGVHVFRALPRERVWALMSRAAVTLMPVEWDEAFGLVAAEAQLAGCPVVGYARGALPEVVPQGTGGVLVTPGDEDALVGAVPVARSIERALIRADASDRFDLDTMADAHERLLLAAAKTTLPTPSRKAA
ncbi:MAG TPA: glycosyltransferase [Candidatus Limnocylindria bacterium]